MQAIIAKEDDEFRKPSTAMWKLFLEHNGPVDLAKSFFCGDAAGRKIGKRKDISDSDLYPWPHSANSRSTWASSS
jgi:histidinol phosphatase-like enzyme